MRPPRNEKPRIVINPKVRKDKSKRYSPNEYNEKTKKRNWKKSRSSSKTQLGKVEKRRSSKMKIQTDDNPN